MTFPEAMQALLRGEKIRWPGWPAGDFVWFKDGDLISNQGFSYVFDKFDVAKKWELYVEPAPAPKTKQVWQWRFRPQNGVDWIVPDQLVTKEVAEKHWPNAVVFAGPFEVEV